jgi:hypothetical protein
MLSNYDRSTWSGTYQDGVDDPRVPLLWDLAIKEKNKSVGYPTYTDDKGVVQTPAGVDTPTVFRGTTYDMPEAELTGWTGGAKGISLVRNKGLFWENKNWAHQIIQASECWFIIAEAYQMGY